jgi:GNAT superfamily N-acetyltransferase
MPIEPLRWLRGEYEIDTDPARFDLDTAHRYIASTYWAEGIPHDTFRRSVEGALCFGVYHQGALIGLARVISDLATIAYLGDVFIDPAHRGQGLARWLMACVHEHPQLQGLRRWILLTSDAHGLYQQFGYTALAKPAIWMEKAKPDLYKKPS